MTFVTIGLAIAGVACIAIPIIIHLLWRQRKRPIEWAAMRFLIEAFRKQRRRLQLEQILLLVLRCLIVALLGMALARPLLQAAGVIEGDDSRVVLLVIDNGIASAIAEPGDDDAATALDRHKQAALNVLEALGEAEPVGVVTAARPIEPPVLPPSIDHSSIARVIESIEPSEAGTDISAALHAAREAASEFEDEGRNVVVYLFSDFRAGSAALDTPLPQLFDPDDDQFTLLAAPPATDTTPNVQVAGIDPVRRVILPGANDGSHQVTVRLERHGGELGRSTTPLRLRGESIGRVDPKTVIWEPGQSNASVTFDINYDLGENDEIGLTAVIDDNDSLDLDNSHHTALQLRERLRIAMVGPLTFGSPGQIANLSPGQWIRWALQPTDEGPMEIAGVLPSTLNDVDLRGVDVAIVTQPVGLKDQGWRALRNFVDDGGLVVITPPVDTFVHSWTDRLSDDLGLPWRIELEEQIHAPPLMLAKEQPASEMFRLISGEFEYLLLTVGAARVLPIDMNETQAEVVLQFDDGSPMMIVGSPLAATDGADADQDAQEQPASGDGLVVYMAVAPHSDWSNLPISGFMTPLFQETLRQGLGIIRGAQKINVGEQPAIVGLYRGSVSLVAPEGNVIDVDRSRKPATPLKRAGLYTVRDDSGRDVGELAVNVDTRAGRTDVQSEAAVAAWLGESGSWELFEPQRPAAALQAAETGVSIAGILLIAVLVLLLIETILARLFSHAFRAKDTLVLSGGLRSTVEPRPS